MFLENAFHAKNLHPGSREMTQQVRALATFLEYRCSFFSAHSWLTIVCKSSSRGSDVHLWTLQTLHTHG